MARTVWILGAGFSKPLGGPLLPELLTTASQARVRAAFPPADYGRLADDENVRIVLGLYRIHGPSAEVAERHWSDAEAFLEALDAASHEARLDAGVTDPAARYRNAPSARLVLRLARSFALNASMPKIRESIDAGMFSLPALASAAKRLVAAECSAFLRGTDPRTSEKWGPYRRWASVLKRDDAIVTFNYDRAVETAVEAAERPSVCAIIPGQRKGLDAQVPILKMHGSVDWGMKGGTFGQEAHDFALTCPDDAMVIGSPGPTKKVTRDGLDQVWQAARTRIAAAEVIVFVGYRFPPSDSEARRFIVDALMANVSQPLTLRTVLGPNRSSADTIRLEAIIAYTMAARLKHHGTRGVGVSHNLHVHPLGAEDFLDLFDAEALGWSAF